jgi:hypothetical protein
MIGGAMSYHFACYHGGLRVRPAGVGQPVEASAGLRYIDRGGGNRIDRGAASGCSGGEVKVVAILHERSWRNKRLVRNETTLKGCRGAYSKGR